MGSYDLSESRDVIGHMTIRFSVGHFLSVSFENKPLSLTVPRYSMANVTQWLTYDLKRPLNKV